MSILSKVIKLKNAIRSDLEFVSKADVVITILAILFSIAGLVLIAGVLGELGGFW